MGNTSHIQDIYTRHMKWSRATFGPVEDRTIDGVIEHIRKELDEVKEAAEDLTENRKEPVGSLGGAYARQKITNNYAEEVCDILILGMELANVMDIRPQHLQATLDKKQTKNEARKWPEVSEQEPGKPIEHLED